MFACISDSDDDVDDNMLDVSNPHTTLQGLYKAAKPCQEERGSQQVALGRGRRESGPSFECFLESHVIVAFSKKDIIREILYG